MDQHAAGHPKKLLQDLVDHFEKEGYPEELAVIWNGPDNLGAVWWTAESQITLLGLCAQAQFHVSRDIANGEGGDASDH